MAEGGWWPLALWHCPGGASGGQMLSLLVFNQRASRISTVGAILSSLGSGPLVVPSKAAFWIPGCCLFCVYFISSPFIYLVASHSGPDQAHAALVVLVAVVVAVCFICF